MRKSGTATKYPGVTRIGPKSYRVRGKVKDPRTGKSKEVDRILEDVTEQQAARMRGDLLDELERGLLAPSRKRLKVGEYAQSWMKSKVLRVDPITARDYAVILDLHILPAFGDYYYDSLTTRDVQTWVDDCLTSSYAIPGGKEEGSQKRKRYTIGSVDKWFRLFHNMTSDAIVELGLERDPTLRVSFPEQSKQVDRKSLVPAEMSRFLAEMRTRYPQHFAITVVLLYTGLRFCHASALKWEDWNEEEGFLRVVRKHVKGMIGPVSRKKRAPREYPVEPELAEILREHRRDLIRAQNPGLAEGWMFPSSNGKVRRRSTLDRAWEA